MNTKTESWKHLETKPLFRNEHAVSEATHSRRIVMEPLEAVISMRFSGSYRREFIREFNSEIHS
jgi:hypothetical protein